MQRQQQMLMSAIFVGEWFASMALTLSGTGSRAISTVAAAVTERRSSDDTFGVQCDHDGYEKL
jgi:hypothetical protein